MTFITLEATLPLCSGLLDLRRAAGVTQLPATFIQITMR